MKQSLMILMMTLIAALVFAADVPQQMSSSDGVVEPVMDAPNLAAGHVQSNSAMAKSQSPFQKEIDSLMEEEKQAIEALEIDFANAPTEAAALQVLKQIEQTKLNTELSLMEFQKIEAQKQGNTELVAKIEACMEQTRSPRPAGVPQNRSTPSER